MRADDVRKAGEYERLCAQTISERKEDNELRDHFILSSRHRYQSNALHLNEKFLSQLVNDKKSYLNSSHPFFKLDTWEDDLRRRRRLVFNLNGTLHDDATINSLTDEIHDDVTMKFDKEDNLSKQQKTQNFLSNNNTDDDDLSLADDKDVDHSSSSPIRYLTECSLICGIIPVHGTLAITHTSMAFDANESDEDFLKLDAKVK